MCLNPLLIRFSRGISVSHVSIESHQTCVSATPGRSPERVFPGTGPDFERAGAGPDF